jgi:hypothetical protein
VWRAAVLALGAIDAGAIEPERAARRGRKS